MVRRIFFDLLMVALAGVVMIGYVGLVVLLSYLGSVHG